MTRYKFFLAGLILFFITSISFAQTTKSLQKSITEHFLMDETNNFQILEETEDSIVIYNQDYEISIIGKLVDKSLYESSEEYLVTMFEKLSAVYEECEYDWNNRKCAFGTFEMTMDTLYSGLALAVPTADNNHYLLFLGYAPYSENSFSQSIIMSCLNSICLKSDEYFTPGPVTSFAFPLENSKEISITIDDDEIKSTINEMDEEAAEFLIEMEYTILRLQKYASDDERIAAWQRYYRIIYRDNYGRIKNILGDVINYYYPLAGKPDRQNEIVFAQKILSWVQNFQYDRAKTQTESDFVSLPAAFCGRGNDCDSRSMMVCAFMQYLNIDSVLLISQEFSHALAGIDIMAPGQMFMFDEKNYLLGETTAKITWGTIVKDHADQSKWFPVYLY